MDPAAAAVPTAAAAAAPAAAAPQLPLTAVLLVQCPDQLGVAAVAQLLYGLGCNIQFTDTQPADESTYCQRVEFDYSKMVVGSVRCWRHWRLRCESLSLAHYWRPCLPETAFW